MSCETLGQVMISIHAPHARSDSFSHSSRLLFSSFQSTLLMRGATASSLSMPNTKSFQSTLLMRGATEDQGNSANDDYNFNPRSSCEERLWDLADYFTVTEFQSTLLMRGATCGHDIFTIGEKNISIHAPHARSDAAINAVNRVLDISIHAPHARSDSFFSPLGMLSIFQSTLLMRGATLLRHTPSVPRSFQSTLLMRGAT